MKSLMTLTALALLSASQANALSCLRADVARTFQWASAAEEQYVGLLGSFDFTMPDTTGADINSPVEARVNAVFSGKALGAQQFQDTAPFDVTLYFACAGPWCGALPDDGTDILGFAERTADGYVVTIDPCYSTVFVEPTPQDVARVEACMRGETCEEVPLR